MGELAKRDRNEIYVVEEKYVIPESVPMSKKSKTVFLAGKNYPMIKDIKDKNEVVNPIHALINQAIMDKGVNIPPEEINYIKKRVTEDILHEFNTLTIEEIRLAFYYGVRGELGEYFGINPTTFYNWLKKYRFELNAQVQLEAKKYLEKPAENDTQMLSERELDKEMAKIVIDVFNELKVNGNYDFYDYGNAVYKFLEKNEMLVLTNEEKFALMDKSREHLRSTFTKRNFELQSKGKEFHKIDLERAFEQLEQKSNKKFEYQVRIGAMRLAVYDFIKKCVDEDLDLEELIQNKLESKDYNDGK